MQKNDSLAYVNADDKAKITQSIWKNIHAENPSLSEQATPRSYIIGGQPGVGKSTSTNKLEAQYEGSIVPIDLDQYREYCPNYKKLYEKYGKESAEYTHCFAKEIRNEILRKR